jgi:hypothetical protein
VAAVGVQSRTEQAPRPNRGEAPIRRPRPGQSGPGRRPEGLGRRPGRGPGQEVTRTFATRDPGSQMLVVPAWVSPHHSIREIGTCVSHAAAWTPTRSWATTSPTCRARPSAVAARPPPAVHGRPADADERYDHRARYGRVWPSEPRRRSKAARPSRNDSSARSSQPKTWTVAIPSNPTDLRARSTSSQSSSPSPMSKC